MSTICPTNNTQFTMTELDQAYNGTSVMEAAVSGSNRDESGMLTKGYLDERVRNLKGKVIPAEPQMEYIENKSQDAIIKEYMEKTNQIKGFVKDEYCFYLARYKFAFKQLITNIANATAGSTGVLGTIEEYTKVAVRLNRKLQDLSQIANAIADNQYATTQNFQTNINDSNSEIQKYFDTLKSHADILRKEVPAVELRKRMVEYTQEKARANKNLLSLYFFLDVVALGLLFYVYKAQ